MDGIPSCSKTNSLNDVTLYYLEENLYLKLGANDPNLSISDIKTKVLEFSKFLNSTGRLSLLRCDKTEYEEFVFLLLALKKSIKTCLTELGQSKLNKKHHFICPECNEAVAVDPKQNYWKCLQNHDHFEELYYKFLNGNLNAISKGVESITLDDDPVYEEASASTSNMEISNENGDSGIDNEIGEIDQNDVPVSLEQEHACNGEEGVNSFRFNFVLHYNETIETKIYPDNLVKAVRKIDKIREYTIQRAGLFRAVCLLCSCDLVARSKISKVLLMDHCMGQRHLRFATNPVNLNALKKYHEAWFNLEPCYQAHQVYFRPEISRNFKCILCNVFSNHKNLISHIQTDPHKTKVLEMFKKRSNAFYLIEQQVQVYGVTKEQVEAKEKETKEKDPVKRVIKTKKRNEKTDSDSSPSSDSKEFKHNIIKSVENASSSNILDLLPNRFKEHLPFLKKDANTEMVSCAVCKITLANDIYTIRKHIRQSMHLKASKITQKKYNYYCEICNLKFLDENAWERHFLESVNKHDNMAESRKKKTSEYECTKCCTVIYGDDLSLTRHLSVSLRRDKKSKEVKLAELLRKLFRTKDTIINEANILKHEANDTLRYNQLTMECCAKLESTLNAVFEGCKAHPFGSRISGLGNRHSDLDVFIDTGDMYTGCRNQDSVAQVQLVRKAATVLSKVKDEYEEVHSIPTARTPIIKLFHKQTEIECDLSFRHGLSVENTKFLRFCLDLQPITQPFILMLKKWSEYNNLSEYITTYALAIMAIFYLQTHNYLFSVKKLRELNPKKSLVINGWETINYTMPMEQMKASVKPYQNTIWQLLRDFFWYYANFSYNMDVICPLLGYTIQKTQFYEGPSGEQLPQEMKSYIAQLRTDDAEQFRAMSPFCIQDPFDLSHNLTKACQGGTVTRLKTLCDLSFKHIDALK